MNSFSCIDTYYFRSSRTLETVLVTNNCRGKVFFVYNYEGYSFRVFTSMIGLLNFFSDDVESDFHFVTEVELDTFFETVALN